MRRYHIPPTIKEREKVIGGVLSLGQFLYLIGGLAFGGVMFFVCFLVTDAVDISVGVGLVFALSGTPFAFFKKNGLTLIQYWKYRTAFNNKTKKLPNKRKDVRL